MYVDDWIFLKMSRKVDKKIWKIIGARTEPRGTPLVKRRLYLMFSICDINERSEFVDFKRIMDRDFVIV